MSDDKLIRVAAVLLRDEAGRLLTVRKRGTSRFMFPGGKREPGEDYRQAAVRECLEETRTVLDPAAMKLLGVFTAPAANEAGFDCQETLFVHPLVPVAGPGAEIEEVRWIDPAQPLPADVAPLVADIVPRLPRRRGIGRVTLYAGASAGHDPLFARAAAELAAELAVRGVWIVYGGGSTGLMGALADAALAAGGHVTGVKPHVLMESEILHPGLTALYNPGGFWDPLLDALHTMTAQGFLKPDFTDRLIVAATPADLIEALTTWGGADGPHPL